MTPVSAVPYTTPDGVERCLRFTLGARKRIAERFGEPDLQAILKKYGDGALPEIAYACMYDDQGKPPNNLTPESLAESLSTDDAVSLLAAVMSAATNGKTPKNELEALLTEAQKSLIGSFSGASPENVSESQTPISGTSPSESLTPSSTDTVSGSESSDSTRG